MSSQSFTGSALAALVKGLPETLERQFEYEDPVVRGGKQLLHSPFFKVTWLGGGLCRHVSGCHRERGRSRSAMDREHGWRTAGWRGARGGSARATRAACRRDPA